MEKVSFYKNATDVYGIMGGIEIEEILRWIMSGDYGLKEAITDIRNCTVDISVKELKKKLPLFTPNGVFGYRNANSLTDYTHVMVLDFDFDTADRILEFKQRLIQYADPLHLYAVWLSPKHGVKALMVHDNTIPAYHYNLFWQVKKKLFPNTPEFDTNCSDICRCCFLSYDPDIFINHSVQPYHFVFDSTVSQQPTQKNYITAEKNGSGGQFKHTPEEIALNTSFQAEYSDKALMNSLVKTFNANNPNYYKDGNRHTEIKRRAVIYCKDGILYDNAVWSLVGQFGENSRSGLKDDDVRQMVSSCYRNARAEFGCERNQYLAHKKGSWQG